MRPSGTTLRLLGPPKTIEAPTDANVDCPRGGFACYARGESSQIVVVNGEDGFGCDGFHRLAARERNDALSRRNRRYCSVYRRALSESWVTYQSAPSFFVGTVVFCGLVVGLASSQ